MGGFEREKHLQPLIAGLVLLLLVGSVWLYGGYRQMLDGLEQERLAAKTTLEQFHQTLQEYRELEAQLHRLEPESTQAVKKSLISTVESATERIAARNQLIYVRPQPDKAREDLVEEGVEIRLENLQLDQVVTLLYQLDSSGQRLRVSQLRLRTRFDDPERLDAVMTLSRLRKKS